MRLQNRFEVLAEMEIQEKDTGVEDVWQSVTNIQIDENRKGSFGIFK